MADIGPVRTYNDANRAFLQAFLARGTLTLDTAKPIIAAVTKYEKGIETSADEVTVDDFNGYIHDANRKLSPLDLEIRSTFHQQTRERIYALVNTTSDPLTQLATTYTADEIAYVKRLLDAMFDGPNNKGRREGMCLSGIDAIQVGRVSQRRETQDDGTTSQAASGASIGARDAESVLGRLTEEGWLEKSSRGFYSLSPRALMELKGWLVDTYNDDDDGGGGAQRDKIKFCHACKEIITVGQRCPTRECPCRLHEICLQNFFRMHRSQTCPLCKVDWDGQHFVGEKAITTSASYQTGRRRTGPGAGAEVRIHDDGSDS